MFTAQQIRHNMAVVDAQGRHIGTVDQVQDDIVELTREGFADELHHFVSLAAVRKIEGDTVVVEPGQATTVEAVAGALQYARRHSALPSSNGQIFGTSGFGTGDGGSGMGH